MGKLILYIGLAILVIGVGPIFVAGLLAETGIGEPFGNALGFALLAGFSIPPGIVFVSVGILICIFNFILSRLPQ